MALSQDKTGERRIEQLSTTVHSMCVAGPERCTARALLGMVSPLSLKPGAPRRLTSTPICTLSMLSAEAEGHD